MLSFQSSVSLLPYNTFHLDVQAKYFVEITAEETLQELFASEIFQKEKKLILGGGANILLTQNFDGLVIKVSIKGIQKMKNEITQLDVTPYQTKGNEQ
jgi:UDP-N-acetylmuramate dehydrogenase